MNLSILCVTKAEPFAIPFLSSMGRLAERLGAQFVLAADGDQARESVFNNDVHLGQNHIIFQVFSQGFIESVLEESLKNCTGDYVLRLDDDEMCSPAMEKWLEKRCYTHAEHWKFPRLHLWETDRQVLVTPHLFPDHQTRLSVFEKAGGRHHIHAGSPFGGGTEAPVCIEHHKFIVKSYTERRAIALGYERKQPGAALWPFSVPEDAYAEQDVIVAELTDGMMPFRPLWSETRRMS